MTATARTGRGLWLRPAIIAALALALVGGPIGVPSRTLAAFPLQSGVRILAPTEGSVVGDGNLFLVDVVAAAPAGGVADRVEVAFDADERWAPAQRDADDPTRWRHVWSDGAPGQHLVRVRAFGLRDMPLVEQRSAFEIGRGWSTPAVLDYPYAGRGAYWKGQLHTHSTFSFDGENSLPPGDLAVAYQRRGYHFLAITDHNLIAHPSEMNSDIFVAIPAYESTAASGHITGLFVQAVAPAQLPPQQRINHIRAAGGMAILDHPSWTVGWTGTDFRVLEGCFAFEVFNYLTRNPTREARNVALWHEVLNAKGPGARIWAVAVDDAHDDDDIDHGWVMLKAPALTEAAVRRALETGAFYASNGPSFSVLGVMNGAITASSPDARTIRFIDQYNRLLYEGPGKWAGYFPTGAEDWIRVEAVMADERRAWSQPFWIIPKTETPGTLAGAFGAVVASQGLPASLIDLFRHGDERSRSASDPMARSPANSPRASAQSH